MIANNFLSLPASDIDFEVTFDGSHAKGKSAEITRLRYEEQGESNGLRTLQFNAKAKPKEEDLVMKVSAKPASNQFVIEQLPADSDETCDKTGLKDLDVIECKGKIKVRPA